MAYYLNYTALSGKFLETPSSIVLSGDFAIKFAAKYPAPSFRFAGHSVDNSRIELDTTSRIRVTNSASTSVTLAFSGVDVTAFNEYEITRTGSTLQLSINGIAQPTVTLAGTINIDRFFVNKIGGYSANCSVKYCEIYISGVLTHDFRNSSGTGNSWIDQVSENHAAQLGTWPSDDSEWVYYDAGGGATITASSAFSMPQMSVAVGASKTAPGYTASASFTMPQMAVSVASSVSAPSVTASMAFSMPQMAVSVIGGGASPSVDASAAFTMPQFAVSATASKTAPSYTASANLTMPQMAVSASGSVLISGNAASSNFAMPQFLVSASATKTVPVNSASVSATMPQMTVQVLTGGLTYYSGDGSHINVLANSRHLSYTKQTTHLNWRA